MRGKSIGVVLIIGAILLGWAWWKIVKWGEHHPRPDHLLANPLWAQIAATNNLPPAEASKVIEAVVARHISVGASFQEAERQLQEAGFTPSRIQTQEYKQYCQADIGPAYFFSPCSTSVDVKLFAQTAGRFGTVAKVTTRYSTVCL